jgi:uncharacterized membrane protein YbhN (UPF0104 family)
VAVDAAGEAAVVAMLLAPVPVAASRAPARPAEAGGSAAPAATAGAAWPAGRAGSWLLAALAAVAVALLAVQLRDAELGAALAGVAPAQLALALGWFALSLLAAVYNLTGFSVRRLRLGTTLLAQLAVGGLRLVAPSALSTPAVLGRYLVRSGASVPDAATTVGAAQTAQLLATIAVVGVLGLGSSNGLPVPGPAVLATAGATAAAAALLGRRNARIRGWARAARHSVAELGRHARQHPTRVAAGVLASAALTVTHVLAFAACVAATGADLPLLTLTAVYLGAAAAGSVIPTPGGLGPVEAALVAGLAAAGLPLPTATAAALLSRLVAVWLPAVPGVVALAVLRRRGLL